METKRAGAAPMLAELPEAKATGRVAEIYADIRAASRVGMVSMCYRHVAATQAHLFWAWRILGPEFVSGRCRALAEAAIDAKTRDRLREIAAGLPAPPELPDEARRGVAANLDAFNRANPLNYLWVGVLVRLLRDEEPHGQDTGEPARLLKADASVAGEFGPVPPIVDVDDMSPAIRAKVMDLADLGLGKTDRIVPSLYRHVVHWPDYIDYIHGLLTRPGPQDDIEAVSFEIRAGLDGAVEVLFADCAARDSVSDRPSGPAREGILETLQSFQPRIPLMIATGNFLMELRP